MPELSFLQLIIVGIGGILPTALTSALMAHNFSQDIYDLTKFAGKKYQEIKKALRRPPSIKFARKNDIDDNIVFAFDELPFESSDYIVSVVINKDQKDTNLLSLDFPNWEASLYKITITNSKTNTTIEKNDLRFSQIIKKLQESYNNSLTDLATNNKRISDVKVGEIICTSTTLAEDHKKLQNPTYFDDIVEAITKNIIDGNHEQGKQIIRNYYTIQKNIARSVKAEFEAELIDNNEKLKDQKNLLKNAEAKAKQIEAKKKTKEAAKKKPLSHNAKAALKWLGLITIVATIATVTAVIFPVAIPIIATIAAATVSGFGVMVAKYKKEMFSGLAFVKIKKDFKEVGIRHYTEEADAIAVKINVVTKEMDDLSPTEENTLKIIDFIHTLNFSESKELNLSKQKLGIIETKIICQNLHKNEKFSKCNKIILPKTATTQQVTEFIAAAAKTTNIREINSSTQFATIEEVDAITAIMSTNLTITEITYGQKDYTEKSNAALEKELAINKYIKTGKPDSKDIKVAAEAKITTAITSIIANPDAEYVDKHLCKLLEALDGASVIYKPLLLAVIDQKSILQSQDLSSKIFIEGCRRISTEELKNILTNGANISLIQGINANSNIFGQLRSLGTEKLNIVAKAFFPTNSDNIAKIIIEHAPKYTTNKGKDTLFFDIGEILAPDTINQDGAAISQLLQTQELTYNYLIAQESDSQAIPQEFTSKAILYIKKLQQTGLDADAALDRLLIGLGSTDNKKKALLSAIMINIIKQQPKELALFVKICNKISPDDLSSTISEISPESIYTLIKEDFKNGCALLKTLNKENLPVVLNKCLAANNEKKFTIDAVSSVIYAIDNYITQKDAQKYASNYIDITGTSSLLDKILSPTISLEDKKPAITQLSINQYLKTGEYTDQTIQKKAEDEVKNHIKKLHEMANIGRIGKFREPGDVEANVISGLESLPQILGDSQASRKALLLAIIDSVEVDKSNVNDSELELFIKTCNKTTTIEELEQILEAVSPKKIYLLIRKDFENNCARLKSLKEKLPSVLSQCFTSSNSPYLKKNCIEYAVNAINNMSTERKNNSVNTLNIILSPSTNVDARNTALNDAKTKFSVLSPDISQDDKKSMLSDAKKELPDNEHPEAKKDSGRKILEKITNKTVLKLQDLTHIKDTKKIEKTLNEVLVNLETVPVDAYKTLLSTLVSDITNEPSTVRDLKLKIFVAICKKNSIDNLSLILPQESLESMNALLSKAIIERRETPGSLADMMSALIIKSINDRSDVFALLQSLGDKLPVVLRACFPENNEMNISSIANIIKKHAVIDDESKEENKRFFAIGKILLCGTEGQNGITAAELLQEQELVLNYLKTGSISSDLQIKIFIAKLTDYIKDCLPKEYKSEEDESERLLTKLTTSLGDTPFAHKALLLAVINTAEDKKITKKTKSLILNVFVKTCKKIESVEEIKRILKVFPDNLLALVREDITSRTLTPLKSLDDNYLKAIIGTLLLDYNDMALTNIIVWHIKKYRATNEDAYKGIPELIEAVLSPDTANEKKDIAIKTLKGEAIEEPSLLGKLFNVFRAKKEASDIVTTPKKESSSQILEALTDGNIKQDTAHTDEIQLEENEIRAKKPADINSQTLQIDKKYARANNPTPTLTPTKK